MRKDKVPSDNNEFCTPPERDSIDMAKALKSAKKTMTNPERRKKALYQDCPTPSTAWIPTRAGSPFLPQITPRVSIKLSSDSAE